MNRISLTSSMRSNLLSLQNISRQVSSTQNKLATGNKVNSAIDNPSSYYTARSLNNRADDLNALLDSMGQAVSTIKAATTALEAGADFLEQATAIATSALETIQDIPAKSYFEEKVGVNGAVVTTAQELKDAVAAGKETIVVYGKIDYFENEGINLKAGQKLVGTEYYTGYSGQQRFSQLNMKSGAIWLLQNSQLSDLDINSDWGMTPANLYSISAKGLNIRIGNITLKSTATKEDGEYTAGIIAREVQTSLELYGKINISHYDGKNSSDGIYNYAGATINSYADITTDGINNNGHLNILNGTVNLVSQGIKMDELGSLFLSAESVLNIKNPLYQGFYFRNATARIEGKINISSSSPMVLQGSSIIFAAGSQLNLYDQSSTAYLTAMTDVNFNKSIQSVADFAVVDGFSQEDNVSFDWEDWDPGAEGNLRPAESYQVQYNEILNQYDALIDDASYKNINLLKGGNLNVKFNETGSAALEVKGRDMSSAALGLQMMDWQTQGDIAQSLKEISAALKSIRSYSAELGNNYSIITNRQDFTENLINILTEGADKLTLADMNEESANMLALQTRQQLAINSLSLASQASQAVLKLF